jgi:hypothetical protein
MWTASEKQAAERLRELAHDRVASPYLVGLLLERSDPDEWADMVEAALVYRERFGASGNDWRQAAAQAMSFTRHVSGHHAPACTCDACQWVRRNPHL